MRNIVIYAHGELQMIAFSGTNTYNSYDIVEMAK